MKTPPPHLTARQKQILEGVMRGDKDGAIAADLGITYSGIRRHMEAMFAKSHTHTRLELALWYLRTTGELTTGESTNETARQ